ncbi:1-acylglycerol-3-phosphate O-acyltransferase [Malassezia vespertilionis]|uniref:1-acyl-sn-glycerol-3-phosphate acyltransferase n=1 Tax=Malassezia vespertilionis TaxID=2020962 RepID=A0A2N1JAP5_9BASI|nr:1-acylglycerol-3-phosphate O-acyltransferase [Malassezia vespertilionis]PKI83625.1 Slc1p [Malassezia vespertilionis]WFD07391.1 1-acylglycerol-3-phosphate O-acyltransferase [Malassezia vespertilionis]
MGILSKELVASFGGATFLLKLVGTRYPKVRFYANFIIYMTCMAICSILGVVYSILLSLVGRRYNTQWWVARSFYKMISSLLGIRITVDGEKNLDHRPAIVLGNHQSILDIYYLGRIFPSNGVVMAKKELRWVPLLGQFMVLGGNVFIDRQSRASALRTMKEAGQHMRKHKLALFAFPEGTRSHTPVPDLLDFKKGIFHLAIETQLPIIPLVCQNYHNLYDSSTRMEGGNIRISVLPPISTKGCTVKDTDRLISTVRNAMLARAKQLGSVPAPGEPQHGASSAALKPKM